MNLHRNGPAAKSRLANAGLFAKQDDPAPADGAPADGAADLNIDVPEDLTALDDAALAALIEQVQTAFSEIAAALGEEAPDQATVDLMSQLRDARRVLAAEDTRRVADRDARAQAAAEIMAEMNGGNADAEAPADAELQPAAAGATETLAAAPAPAPVVAPAAPAQSGAQTLRVADPVMHAAPAGTFARGTINLANIRRAGAAAPAPDSPFRAAVNVPGLRPGQILSDDEVAGAFDQAMGAASKQAIWSAQRAGQRFSQRYPIAQVARNFAGHEDLIVGERENFDTTHPAYKAALAPALGGAESLVAAGGWCAPSETIYDLCSLESSDGLISIPEVNVGRGGINFTQGPDWADIFSSTGFCFTEADDIAGIYGNNEVQSVTEGGSGLTSFTLTFNGQTTTSIPAAATAAQVANALQALSNIGPENVNVTGPTSGPWLVEFVNALGGTNVAQMTATPTGGSGTVTVATVTAGDAVVSNKPCDTIPCPPFTNVRLNVCGVCITGANLQDRAYPELTRRYVGGSLTAHRHRLATQVIASMITGSTAVAQMTPPTGVGGVGGVVANLLNSIELQVEDIKYRRRMARNSVIEVVLPYWARAILRADVVWRLGVTDPFNVTDAQIDQWLAMRGVSVQYVYNWQNLGGGTAAVRYPATLQFLIYPAGTWVKGVQDVINLEMLHDSTLNATNNFTAIFTEEAWSVMKMCHDSRVVSVAVCPTGEVNLGHALSCT